MPTSVLQIMKEDTLLKKMPDLQRNITNELKNKPVLRWWKKMRGENVETIGDIYAAPMWFD